MFDRLFVGQEDEISLVEKAKTSQHDFARLYDKFADVVYRFVRWKVATDQDAEDIVSETFMAVAQKIKDYDTTREQKVTTRILAIAQYKFLDHMRVVYKERENTVPMDEYFDPGYEDDFATILTNKDIYENIIAVVKTLPERQSSVFFLRYIEWITNKEIAAICDIEEKTVSSTLSHAIKKIKHTLESLYNTHDTLSAKLITKTIT